MPVSELFRIEDLHARPVVAESPTGNGQRAAPAEILRGIDLSVQPGEIHALMGPNGSGKSTLANALLANPEYEVTKGRILFQGDDITDWPTEVRAKAGMFLAFQYPQEIPGVSVIQFLRQALSARKGIDLSVLELRLSIMEWMKRLGMDSSFADRYLNEGFSGGEKKRNEILQMAILEPELAILDETDSGLDIDALRTVASGIHEVRRDRTELGIVLITHYQRLLNELTPDHVHILVGGRIVASGGLELAEQLERDGYEALRAGAGDTGALDVARIRKDFPLLDVEVDGRPIVYLDSANSSQKPRVVIDAMTRFMETAYAPINRSAYKLAAEATEAYEGARLKAQRFINAPHPHELIFTKNATEGLNLVAYVLGPGEPPGRRRGRAHPDGAPRQHRALAPARRRPGHRAALGPAHGGRATRPHRPGPPARRGQGVRLLGHVERAGHHQPGAAPGRRRARRRGAGHRRRLPVRPPQPH